MAITLTREEARQVLDVIERNIVGVPRYRATELFRTRLAQPEPEPVAWMMLENKLVPMHTAPPQREWVGLTDDEHMKLAEEWGCLSADWVLYAAAIERKIKEKNT
jgi:hypothetical protein